MIFSFKDKETKKVFNNLNSKKIPQEIQKRAFEKLQLLDSATSLNDLKIPPSNHLEALIGDRAGEHSIRINQKYRICFNWNDGQTYNVEIVDYH